MLPSTINIVLFGETGVGKSSVINLIAQKQVAEVSSNVDGCTMQSTRYIIPFDGFNFAIFDTVGLEEPQFGINGYLKALEKAYELIMQLSAAGGIHLLLFCLRGRLTATTQSNYRLFAEYLCDTKVPIALVFTGLKREEEMEDWWGRNQKHIEHYGIKNDGHACIMAVESDIPGEDLKFTESQKKIRELLKDFLFRGAFMPETLPWFSQVAGEMMDFIQKRRKPKKRDVTKVLTRRCKLDLDTAKRIVDTLNLSTVDVAFNGIVQVDVNEPFCYTKEVNTYLYTKSQAERLGDAAMGSKNHDDAITSYSNALSIDPTDTKIVVKCCRAWKGFMEDELANATKNIELHPSSYKMYRRKHTILRGMGRHQEAFEAFEMMLSCLQGSLDPKVRDLRGQYLDTAPLIRKVIQDTIRDTPNVLIDITTGRLCNKAQQAAAFEQLPIFNELRSSMITRDRVDYPRIRREVEMFYRYVMFSHRWQLDEPTFQMIENMSIYSLPDSPANNKLIKFCYLVDRHDFRWAWSDTCCVNQADNRVQQESVIAMFRWYHGSSLTIVHLLGVLSESQKPDSLWKSIWNTRGWTYQEYVASKVVQFYTEDWKPYLGLKMFNHKESPIILAEMARVTMFATQDLNMLQPGLDRVREKLYLASKRQTTREEDIAYSLFGIFSIAIPVMYGEGKQAVGRFLEHVLTRSANVTILAWTGKSGSHHSYLPSDLTVYDQIVPPHVPLPTETDDIGTKSRLSLFSSRDSLAIKLYKELDQLSPPSLVAGRLKLSGLVFPLFDPIRVEQCGQNSKSSTSVYCATTAILGDVEIQTTDDLSGMKQLILIHPWIAPLLDADLSEGSPEIDLVTRARRLVVRLRQPFGALLLTARGRDPYRRVATDCFIKTQVRQKARLKDLIASVRTVDIQ